MFHYLFYNKFKINKSNLFSKINFLYFNLKTITCQIPTLVETVSDDMFPIPGKPI